MTLNSIAGIQEEYDNLKQDVFVVWSRYDARERNSFHYLSEKNFDSAKVMPVIIRSDSTFKNAQALNKSVFELKKPSAAKEDMDLFSQELIGLRDYFSAKEDS